MSIELVMPSIHPLLSPYPCAVNLSQQLGLSNESVLRIMWPKYWSFSFIINPSNEYSGLISFRIDWFDHLDVKGMLRSLLQHHSLKALCPLDGLTLVSVHDYRKDNSLDYTDLCWQSDVLAF